MRQAKQITVTIVTSNDAFEECEQAEVSRILRKLCREFAHGIPCPTSWPLHDENGNTCGQLLVNRDD